MNNTEQKVAETLLELPKVITIGGIDYDIAPPTIGTLAMMSAEISKLDGDGTDIQGIIKRAESNADILTRIGAIVILGAKVIKQKGEKELILLADRLSSDASVAELAGLVTTALDTLDISGFFVLTTSLKGASILKPTKSEVGEDKEVTAFGA